MKNKTNIIISSVIRIVFNIYFIFLVITTFMVIGVGRNIEDRNIKLICLFILYLILTIQIKFFNDECTNRYITISKQMRLLK